MLLLSSPQKKWTALLLSQNKSLCLVICTNRFSSTDLRLGDIHLCQLDAESLLLLVLNSLSLRCSEPQLQNLAEDSYCCTQLHRHIAVQTLIVSGFQLLLCDVHIRTTFLSSASPRFILCILRKYVQTMNR